MFSSKLRGEECLLHSDFLLSQWRISLHRHANIFNSSFIHSVVLTHFAEDLCHLKGPRGVHVGGNDGDASVGLFRVTECEGPPKVNLNGDGV